MAEQDEYLDVAQIVELYRISEATAWNYIRSYDLPRYRIPARGRRTVIRKSDLDAALQKPIPIDRPRRKIPKG